MNSLNLLTIGKQTMLKTMPIKSTKKIICKHGNCNVIELFKPVHRYSRCGSSGKLLKCPNCESTKLVFNLAWPSLTCQSCKLSIDKYDYMIENEVD